MYHNITGSALGQEPEREEWRYGILWEESEISGKDERYAWIGRSPVKWGDANDWEAHAWAQDNSWYGRDLSARGVTVSNDGVKSEAAKCATMEK